MKKLTVAGILVVTLSLLQGGLAWANKSGASIEGPTSVEKGTEVTLRITITHNANSMLHYTDWVKVTANNKEIARWEYTRNKRPEGAEFTKEIKIEMMEDTEIVAEAHCNMHGSRGPAVHKITVK